MFCVPNMMNALENEASQSEIWVEEMVISYVIKVNFMIVIMAITDTHLHAHTHTYTPACTHTEFDQCV